MRLRGVLVLAFSTLCRASAGSGPEGTVHGELKLWHKVTIDFTGPRSSEGGVPNPFTDYRLDVTFRTDGKRYVVPGYFAADGNAAHTGAAAGSVWRARFAPDETGRWTYSAEFTSRSRYPSRHSLREMERTR